MNQPKMVMDVHQKPKPAKWLMLSFQHLFAMFGSTILVPFIVDLDPSVALISSGLGTLAYLLITRGQIPALSRLVLCLYCSDPIGYAF